jgi:hypothetical protein
VGHYGIRETLEGGTYQGRDSDLSLDLAALLAENGFAQEVLTVAKTCHRSIDSIVVLQERLLPGSRWSLRDTGGGYFCELVVYRADFDGDGWDHHVGTYSGGGDDELTARFTALAAAIESGLERGVLVR